MKRQLFLALFVIVTSFYFNLSAQINMRCTYIENYKHYVDNDKANSDEMILEIGAQSSEYYSLWNRARQAVVDSLSAKGASFEEVYTARERLGYPNSPQCFTIYKHYPEKGELLYIDRLIGDYYQYTEKMTRPEWEMQMEKKEIAGYTCQKATADYLGRTWIAWFTTDIPISDGPWKLWGLPGLIVAANDSDNLFSFKCIEVKKADKPYVIKLPKKNYIKLSKDKFMQEATELAEDMHTFAKKRGKFAPVALGNDGKPEAPVKRKHYPIER